MSNDKLRAYSIEKDAIHNQGIKRSTNSNHNRRSWRVCVCAFTEFHQVSVIAGSRQKLPWKRRTDYEKFMNGHSPRIVPANRLMQTNIHTYTHTQRQTDAFLDVDFFCVVTSEGHCSDISEALAAYDCVHVCVLWRWMGEDQSQAMWYHDTKRQNHTTIMLGVDVFVVSV